MRHCPGWPFSLVWDFGFDPKKDKELFKPQDLLFALLIVCLNMFEQMKSGVSWN